MERTKNEIGGPPPIVPIHDNSHWVVLYQYIDSNGMKSFNGNDPIYYDTKTKVGPSDGGSFSWIGKINVAHKTANFKSQDNLLLIEQTAGGTNITSRMARNPFAITLPITPVVPPARVIPADTVQKLVPEKLSAFGVSSPCLAGRHL